MHERIKSIRCGPWQTHMDKTKTCGGGDGGHILQQASAFKMLLTSASGVSS